jgi:MHS family proline/betaine transporter-like MFS transporter
VTAKRRATYFAVLFGNVIVWFNFALFGSYAAYFSQHYFSQDFSDSSRILTYLIFGSAFLMRPVGALLFGTMGDRLGRRAALIASMSVMALSTLCIGFLPTPADWGFLSPALLVAFRLLQGIALGGEHSGSMTYLAESVSDMKKGSASSLALVSAVLGLFLSTLLAGSAWPTVATPGLQSILSRWPFLAGGVLGGVVLIFRAFAAESPEYYAHAHVPSNIGAQDLDSLRPYTSQVLIGVAILAIQGSAFYTLFVFLPTEIIARGFLAPRQTFSIQGIALALLALLSWGIGHASDYIRPHRLIAFGAILYLSLVPPLFLAILPSAPNSLLFVLCMLSIPQALVAAPCPGLLVRSFPVGVRARAVALTFNCSLAIFGGFSPVIAAFLSSSTRNFFEIFWCITANALVTLWGLFLLGRNSFKPRNGNSGGDLLGGDGCQREMWGPMGPDGCQPMGRWADGPMG